MEMYSPSGHPRCRWAFVFFRTDLEKFSIISLDLAFWTEAVVDLFLTNSTFRKMLIDKLDLCGLLWCFISYLDSHYDVTHSPQRIHWRASDVMLNFSKLFRWGNKLILDDLRVSAFSFFKMNTPFLYRTTSLSF